MQIPTDPLDAAALAVALTPGQRIDTRDVVEVDWNRDGLYSHALSALSRAVSQCRVQREASSNAPGTKSVLSGASSGKLTVTLTGALVVSGVAVDVTELFAPYNSTSPLYKVPLTDVPIRWTVETSTSRGWIGVRQFTGWLDEREVRRVGGQVILTALDIPPKLRDPARWQPWAVDGPAAARVNDYAPQRGLASSLVDRIFNDAGLLTRPRPPWVSHTGVACLAYLPLCGSFAPARGRQLSQAPWGNFQMFPATYNTSPGLDAEGSYWVAGPFGLARDGEASRWPGSLIYTTSDQQPTWTGQSTSVSAWIYCGPTAPGYDDNPSSSLRPQVAAVYFGFAFTGVYYAYRVSIGSAGPTVQVQCEIGTDRHYFGTYTPGTNAWRHVHAQVDHSVSPPAVKLFVDGTQQVSFSATGSGNSVAAVFLNQLFFPKVGFHLRPGVRMSDAMAWQETGSATVTPERTFTPGATVARSLNEISYLPRPSDSGWKDLEDLSEAEFAVIRVDEDGHVRWDNRVTVRSTQDPQTMTLSYPSEIATTETDDGYANTIQFTVRSGEASWKNAWEAPSVDTIIAPVGTTTWLFPMDDDVIAIESGTVPRLYQSVESASLFPVWSGNVDSGYVFVFDATETETTDQNMTNLTDQSGLGDDQVFRIVVTNSDTSGRSGRFRLKNDATGSDPQPALRIAGLVLAQPSAQTTTLAAQAAVTADGKVRTVPIRGGSWHQYLGSVQSTAMFVLRRSTQRIPTFTQFTVPGDPRRQVTDRVILELGVCGPRVLGYIASITRTSSDKGVEDSLVVVATHGPGGWALGDPVWGLLESTAVLG